MRQSIVKILFVLCVFLAPQSRADLFGGDVAVLTQILVNNVQQLMQLMDLLKTGKKQLELMEDVKSEVFRTINSIQNISTMIDPSVYKDWSTVEYAIRRLQTEYGVAVPSPNYQVERDTDQSIAEAITINNNLFAYSKQMDRVGDQIKRESESVSPGAAQKVTAHTQGIMLHAMNQNLRAQATLIKLQAQNMAIKNREAKQLTKSQISTSEEMERELRKKKQLFKLPRF
jgi:hypothetical protein